MRKLITIGVTVVLTVALFFWVSFNCHNEHKPVKEKAKDVKSRTMPNRAFNISPNKHKQVEEKMEDFKDKKIMPDTTFNISPDEYSSYEGKRICVEGVLLLNVKGGPYILDSEGNLLSFSLNDKEPHTSVHEIDRKSVRVKGTFFYRDNKVLGIYPFAQCREIDYGVTDCIIELLNEPLFKDISNYTAEKIVSTDSDNVMLAGEFVTESSDLFFKTTGLKYEVIAHWLENRPTREGTFLMYGRIRDIGKKDAVEYSRQNIQEYLTSEDEQICIEVLYWGEFKGVRSLFLTFRCDK